jgi:hypothetical protein
MFFFRCHYFWPIETAPLLGMNNFCCHYGFLFLVGWEVGGSLLGGFMYMELQRKWTFLYPCRKKSIPTGCSLNAGLCGFCLCGIRRWKSHVRLFLGMKELLNLPQRCWLGRAGPIPSYDLTLLDIIWTNVTEHIYIQPIHILLTEGHTEIEHVLRLAFFWDFTQHNVVIAFWNFWITNQSHLQGSRCPRRTCLGSRQPAHTGCLLEELTVTELIWW